MSIKRYILTLFWAKAVSCSHSLVFQVMSTCMFCISSYFIVWESYLSHQTPTCCDHRLLIVSWAEVCALGVSAFPWHRERGDRKSLCFLLLLRLVSLCHQSDSLSGVCWAIMDLPSLGHHTFPQQPSSALSEPSRAAAVQACALFFFSSSSSSFSQSKNKRFNMNELLPQRDCGKRFVAFALKRRYWLQNPQNF